MDTKTKQIALEKLKEIENNIFMIKDDINKDIQFDEILEKLRNQGNLIYDLRGLLKAFSITEKVNQGRHQEAAEEARRPY